MALLFPTVKLPKAYDITARLLREKNISGLILDIDNTLTTHDHPIPNEKILEWLTQMKRAGIGMILLSNNHPARVEPFARRLKLPFEADGKKPLPGGYHRAAASMGFPAKNVAVVGDQIFTDILGANLAGMPSILVEPFEMEPFFQFKIKRFLEKWLLIRYDKKQRKEER